MTLPNYRDIKTHVLSTARLHCRKMLATRATLASRPLSMAIAFDCLDEVKRLLEYVVGVIVSMRISISHSGQQYVVLAALTEQRPMPKTCGTYMHI